MTPVHIYVFTLTVSICCFWNNQQQGPWAGGAGESQQQVALNLGFMIMEAGPDYAPGRQNVWGSSWCCFLQGFLTATRQTRGSNYCG